MNKSESKYFNTALKMDKAFLEILEKKEFEYITVKEICERAGVNRSTFYLHYETVEDLLAESVEYMQNQFLDYMRQNSYEFVSRLKNCPQDELYLITPKYLSPYLNYIKENKCLFHTAIRRAKILRMDESYEKMFRFVFMPILERFRIPSKDRTYIMKFYISGLMGIITEWLREDCSDSVEYIIAVIQRCVMQHQHKEER